MILLNRRNHHVVENHVIEIHVIWGTTVFSEILSSRWLDRFCLLGIFKIVDSRWSGPILVLHYIFHAVLVSNGNNSEILSSVKKGSG